MFFYAIHNKKKISNLDLVGIETQWVHGEIDVIIAQNPVDQNTSISYGIFTQIMAFLWSL